MHRLNIHSKTRAEIIDITADVQQYITKNRFTSGLIVVYSPHTTAGLSVNENADPDVKRDINRFLEKTVPQNFGFNHAEGNSDAHIKGSLVGFSYSLIVEGGKIQLGTWQGLFFMEFDGPRSREVWLKFIPGG